MWLNLQKKRSRLDGVKYRFSLRGSVVIYYENELTFFTKPFHIFPFTATTISSLIVSA